MDNQRKIELLSPAGDLEKLKIACQYGADAVYIGGKSLGLRAGAKNFANDELREGIEFAHERGVKVYVTTNIFAHNEDLTGADEYFKELYEIGADAVIISDPGMFMIARQAAPELEIHISTQANNTNYMTANFWKQQGAARIVMARELSMGEIAEIHRNAPDIEIEAFIHGAMCISYSGRCLLSNVMAGRDGNRGQCAHPCRWNYNLVEEKRPGEYFPVFEDERGTYILNSRDLCMIEHLPDVITAGITSLKIEGRMKTAYYTAVTTRAYRAAIDDYLKDPELYERNKPLYMEELRKASHRKFTAGFYYNKPTEEDQVYDSSTYIRDYDFIGVVQDYDPKSGMAIVEQRNHFSVGDEVEMIGRDAPLEGQKFTVTELYDIEGNPVPNAPHPKQMLRMKMNVKAAQYDILRKAKGTLN